MASGMSKAHQRQSKANEGRRLTRRNNTTTEVNQLRRLLRHAKHFSMLLKIGANSSLTTFFYQKPDGILIEDSPASKAWQRCADRAGVARTRAVLHTRSIPQANTIFSFARV